MDTWGVEAAQACGLEVKVYLPDWSKYGRAAGFQRNQKIVDDCDSVLAFWDLKSRGTQDTIRKALKQGKKVRVLGPDGEQIDFERLGR